jgi:hypothetical protein
VVRLGGAETRAYGRVGVLGLGDAEAKVDGRVGERAKGRLGREFRRIGWLWRRRNADTPLIVLAVGLLVITVYARNHRPNWPA